MRKFLFVFIILSTNRFTSEAQAPLNDDCANSTLLIGNGACVNGTTLNAGTQSGELLSPSCAASNFNQTVWYRFEANSAHMYVQIYTTGYSGSGMMWGPTRWCCVVYNSSTCLPGVASVISCQNSSSEGTGDAIIINDLNGLTIGESYLIQIGYRTGNGINQVPNFCISVGNNFTTDCSQCSSSCGNACGFSTAPSVSTVVNNCQEFDQAPYKEGGQNLSQCYLFIATNTAASFNVVITSTCLGGNVSSFTWTLQSSSCGPVLQSGNLNNLSFTGLTIGNAYTFCYTLTVPASCYHESYYPYFVGAIPLPIELVSFTATTAESGILLDWMTEAEINNDYFSVQHSTDGINFIEIGKLPGAGNSMELNEYHFTDISPSFGKNYYRLVQFDYEGYQQFSKITEADFLKTDLSLSVFPNPVTKQSILQITSNEIMAGKVSVFDLLGKVIRIQPVSLNKGMNAVNLDFDGLMSGVYQIQLDTSSGTGTISVMK